MKEEDVTQELTEAVLAELERLLLCDSIDESEKLKRLQAAYHCVHSSHIEDLNHGSNNDK
jgi:hypothetical protein